MKKSELINLIREEIQGYSPQIGKTKGLTPDTLNKILKKIASGDDYEPEGEVEEGDGLWANIRAKIARGEKPAHKNSKAHKDAVKAGKKINKMSEEAANLQDGAADSHGFGYEEISEAFGQRALDSLSSDLSDIILDFFKANKVLRKEPHQRKYKSGLSPEEFVKGTKEMFLKLIFSSVKSKVLADTTITKESR